jgi:predicted DCC family thiol-disulfide oxidoreductase YuxK
MIVSLSQGRPGLKSQIEPRLKIVFFDGICHLCNGFVDFAIQNGTDRNALVYAPLQGETAKKYLTIDEQNALSSVLVWSEGKTLHKSSAVISILKDLKSPWPFFATLMGTFPESLRNSVYDFVAKNRYSWFGRRDSCRLPKPEEKNKLWP